MNNDSAGLTEVFVARRVCLPPAPAGTPAGMAPGDCFRIHRVHWQETRLSEDGTRLICRFRAPDAESVRIALRLSGIPFEAVWSCPGPRRELPPEAVLPAAGR